MTIISRYVFRQVGSALLLILSSLSGIVWIALALRQLNIVTAQGQDAVMLLKMTTLALPNLMALIAPFALLIASIHTLNRLNGDSELIVLTAAGAKTWVVARPLLALAFIVAAAVSLVNHQVMPASLRLLRQYIIEVRTNLLTQVIQPGRFTSPEEGVTFHIRERAANGDLMGLIMHDTRKNKETQSYLASRAAIVMQDRTAYLRMTDGHILRRGATDEPARIVAFREYAVNLDGFEKEDAEASDLKPRERFFGELVTPERNSPSYKRSPGQFRSELHERFASPFYPIAFVLIALACVGQAQSTRRGRMERIVLGFALAGGLKLAGLAAVNFVSVNASALVLLYGLPGAAIIAALIMIRRGTRPRTGPSPVDRVRDLMEPIKLIFAAARPRAALGT